MKKYIMSLMVVVLAVFLCACGTEADKKGTSSTEVKETEVLEEVENTLPTEDEEQKYENTTEKTEEYTSGGNDWGTESTRQESVQPSVTTEEVTSEGNYPGADVVEIVNLRGDKTTVYKLADGTYMDRIERRFTYNGTDTWTDEDGAEWNETVK